MKILAIDFSSPQRSVAVRNGTSVEEVIETDVRSVHAFDMIETALRAAGVDRQQIERVVVGLGPGSYTGIRASIAIAQGWQLAADVKLMGLSSVEAIAMQARDDGTRGQVHVVIDAQRGEFYLATYDLGESGIKEATPLAIVQPEAVRSLESGSTPLLGPDVSRTLPNVLPRFPRAATLAQMAASRKDFVRGEQLEPIYLRETTFVKAPPARTIPGL